MNESRGITTSSLAITEKRPQRPGGCVGIFFQLFDWNRRFAKKKLFTKKLISPARLKQASKKFGAEKQPKLRLIADENSGGFPNVKSNGNAITHSQNNCEMLAPGLVARLMGLESMPAAKCNKPQKASAYENGTVKASASGEFASKDLCFDKAEIKNDLRPQKLQKTGLSERHPVTRFGAEALQFKNVLSRSKKHQPKLVSPVKGPRNVSGRNASRLIGAATRILEPGLQKGRAKCITYPRDVFVFEDKADKAPDHLEASNSYVNSKTLKGTLMDSCDNCGHSLRVKDGRINAEGQQYAFSSPVSSYSEHSCQGLGRNMPGLPIFSPKDKKGRGCEGHSDATAKINDISYCAELILRKRHVNRSHNVEKDVSSITHVHQTQKQNQMLQGRVRGLTKSKSSRLQSNNVSSAASAINETKNFVAQNRRLSGFTRSRIPATADGGIEAERKLYYGRSDSLSPQRKRRSINVSTQNESSSIANATMGRESGINSNKTSGRDAVLPIHSVDRPYTKPKLSGLRESSRAVNSCEGGDVVSFTFNSPMKQKGGMRAEVVKKKSQNGSNSTPGRSFCKGSEEKTCLQQHLPLKEGDIIGALLQQKLKELTCQEDDFAEGGTLQRKSTAVILQELITALTAERQFLQVDFPVSPDRKHDSSYPGDMCSRNSFMNFQSKPKMATVSVGNSLDIDHHSPGSILEATFSNYSCLSSSLYGSSNQLLAESMDSVYDELLSLEPETDLWDSATSLYTGKNHRALITDLVNRISDVLCKIDNLKGFKLSHAKDVVLNAELVCGSATPPADEGFPTSYFLLDELEMLSSLIWMTVSQLLGCYDPKENNQLKEFAFDCVIEYLDSKIGQYSNSGFRSWTKLQHLTRKESRIADIINEVKLWTEFAGMIPDELIEWDMSHSLGKWTDFKIEEFECGNEVDSHILQALLDEIVLDICECR